MNALITLAKKKGQKCIYYHNSLFIFIEKKERIKMEKLVIKAKKERETHIKERNEQLKKLIFFK